MDGNDVLLPQASRLPSLPSQLSAVPALVELHLAPIGAQLKLQCEEDLWTLLRDLLGALAKLEVQHLVHRDIREANIVWSGNAWLLIDWELVCRLLSACDRTRPGASEQVQEVGCCLASLGPPMGKRATRALVKHGTSQIVMPMQ